MRAAASVALFAAALADPAAARFAPVAGRAYRLTTETVRDDGATARRFTIEREIVFQRDATGYSAAVTTLPASPGVDPSSALFASAFHALAGTKIGYRLDRDGHVLAVDDLDAAWEALAASIDSMPPPGDHRRTAAVRLGDHLRGLPVERRRAMFASILEPLVPVPMSPGTMPVTVTGEALDGSTRLLHGRRTIRRDTGTIQVAVVDATDGETAPALTIAQTITTDLATGLLRTSEERRVQQLPGEPDRHLTVTTRTTLILKVS